MRGCGHTPALTRPPHPAALKGKEIMSTGFDHSNKNNPLTFGSINRQVHEFDAVAFMSEGAVQTPATRTQRLVTIYASARPILAALAAIPLIPAAWRTVMTIFVSTL